MEARFSLQQLGLVSTIAGISFTSKEAFRSHRQRQTHRSHRKQSYRSHLTWPSEPLTEPQKMNTRVHESSIMIERWDRKNRWCSSKWTRLRAWRRRCQKRRRHKGFRAFCRVHFGVDRYISPHVVQSVEPFMIVFKTPDGLILRAIPSFFVFGRMSSNEAKGVFILDLKTVFMGVFIQFEYCLHGCLVSSF